MSPAVSPQQTRINYIDALRGLSMILVVLAHVFLFMSPRAWDGSPVSAILISFRMPLFFFVSGFFAYRALDRWSKYVVEDIMTRKIRAQIICTLVFYTLYQLVHHRYVLSFLNEGFNYFWFTIALFQMFSMYVLANIICRLTVRRDWVDWIMVAAVAAVYLLDDSSPVGIVLSWHKLKIYFMFFVAGIFARKYWHKFEKLLETDWFVTTTIVLFVGGCFLYYSDWYSSPHNLWQQFGQGVIHRFSGLVCVLVFFHSRKWFWDTQAPVARFLRFTGKRTLDIYMMHMFFMPHLAKTGLFAILAPPNMVILKLALTLPITLGIVVLCLICSQLLRSSNFLAVWLFGVRRKAKHSTITSMSNR